MSAKWLSICSAITEDAFGAIVKQVVETLIVCGSVRLKGIVTHSKLPLKHVKSALKILFQHNLIIFEANERFCDPFYELNGDAILFLSRVPQFLASVEDALGPDARKIVDEVARAGQVTISKLYYALGYKFKKENESASDNALFERLVAYRNALRRTVERKYVCLCPRVISEPSDHVPKFESIETDRAHIPQVDLRLLCDKLVKKDSNLDSLPDASTFWKINDDQFRSEFKNEILIEAVNRKFRKFLEPAVFRALLELGTKDTLFPCISAAVPVLDVHQRLTKTLAAPPTLERVKEQLGIIEEDMNMRIITKSDTSGHGSYVVNVKSAFTHIMWSTIEKTIQERRGIFAARIFRMVKKLHFVEQEKIDQVCMIPAKNCRELTYHLVEDHFLMLKEIRKSYAAKGHTTAGSFMFHIDIHQIVQTLMESCYQAMTNLRMRVRVEKNRHLRLVAKEERIERILANMINNKCTEEQLKEVRDMITPPERTVLNKYKTLVNKLTSAHLHVDNTLFVAQTFLLYTNLSK